MLQRSVHTQFGDLTLSEEEGMIVALSWGKSTRQDSSVMLNQAAEQLLAYDARQLKAFDLPLRVSGSQTQQAVCREISAIPFGYTLTYGEIAQKLGISPQVVGQACGGNPIPIIIPCHRVMGTRGLTGFSGAGGVETKVALLRHEGAAGLLI